MKKYLKLFGFLIFIVIVFSCTIKNFEAPEFDKKIVLPLINETYYMSDLADTTDDYILVVECDTMIFSVSQEFDTKKVGEDDLKIDGKEETFDSQIGDELMIDSRSESSTIDVGDDLVIDEHECEIERSLDIIEVDETGDATAHVVVLEFANEALGGGIDPIYGEIIPPFYEFPPFNQDFTLFENNNIEYVVIDTGSVYVAFINNTELPLSSDLGQEYQMHFDFYTNGTAADDDGMYMFTHYIDHLIGAGETENLIIPFDGQSVYMTNYLKCFLTTDGTGDEPINVLEDDSFDAYFAVGEMTVSEASAIIEVATVNHIDAISISDDEILVINAEIESCLGNIYIENNLPFDVDTLIIEFIELFDPSDQPFRIEGTGFLQGNSYNIPIDLQNCLIHSESDTPLDSLHFLLYASIDPPPGYVLITQEDKILTRITFGEMSFLNVTGIINQESSDDDSILMEDETIELQSAIIRSGNMNISLTGVDLQNPSSISILFDEIKDPNDNFNPLELIIENNFDDFEYDLTDHRIDLTPDQIIHYHTTVMLDQLITITNTDVVDANIIISDLIFEIVTGVFGSFTFEDESSTVVDSTGEFSVFFAEILDCEITIDIIEQNYTLPFSSDINLVFNEIFTPEGEPYEINFHCPGDTTFNFAGFTIGNDPFSTIPIDSLHYSYSIVTDDSEGQCLTVNYDDEVAASVLIGDMVFQEIQGIIDHKRVDMDDIEEDIDIEDLPDSLAGLLEFQVAELHLDMFNQIGFDCWIYMHLIGSNDEGDTAEIIIDDTIDNIMYAESTTEIVVIEGVNELLNIIPTLITVTDIYAIIGDGLTPGSIALNDSISGSYEVVTPLKFIIEDYVVTDSIDAIEMDDDSQDMIEDNINGVKLVVSAENKFPFGSDIRIFFSTDSTLIFTAPQLVIDSLSVEAAEIIGGVSGEPTTSELVVDLYGDDFNVFLDREYQDVYTGIELSIIGTGGEVVTIRGSDNIKIIGYLEADVHIAGQEE